MRIIGVAGIAGLTLKTSLDRLTAVEEVQETRLLMGTVVNLTLITQDAQKAREAIQACFRRMAALEGVLSRFLPDSQLARLNQVGALANAHPSLVEVVQQAKRLGEASEGAFEISVQPLYDLYEQYKQRENRLPPLREIERVMPNIGYQYIGVRGKEIVLRKPQMKITLDGIAKGYIVDQGVLTLRQAGYTNVLVEAGGDLCASGEKALDLPWTVGVQAPRESMGNVLTKIALVNQAVATSGDYMQPFTDDLSQHHILDPRKGISPSELSSATVVAPTCALADALATTMMVLGVDRGLALVKRFPEAKAILVTKDGEVVPSENWDAG